MRSFCTFIRISGYFVWSFVNSNISDAKERSLRYIRYMTIRAGRPTCVYAGVTIRSRLYISARKKYAMLIITAIIQLLGPQKKHVTDPTNKKNDIRFVLFRSNKIMHVLDQLQDCCRWSKWMLC